MGIRVSVMAAAVFVLGAATIQAQTITTGVKAGIDWSSLPNAAKSSTRSFTSRARKPRRRPASCSASIQTVPFYTRLAFQPELQFVMKGVELNEASSGGTVSARIRYLSFRCCR